MRLLALPLMSLVLLTGCAASSAEVATGHFPKLPEMPFPFPERTEEEMAAVVRSIRASFELPVQIRGPYEMRQLEWIAQHGEVQFAGGTSRRDDFLSDASVAQIRAVVDEKTEVYYYESFMESDGVVLGGESGYVVVREGRVVLKLEMMRV